MFGLSAQSLVVSLGPMGQQPGWVWLCLPDPVGSGILLGCGDLLVGPYGLRVLYCRTWLGPMGSGVVWLFLDSPVPMGSGIVCAFGLLMVCGVCCTLPDSNGI